MRLPFHSSLRRAAVLCVLFCVLPAAAFLRAQDRLQSAQGKLSRHVRPEVLTGRAQLIGPLDPAERLHLSLVLPLRNQPELDSLLQRLYDPSSTGFHHFLTVSQFTHRFAPTLADCNAALAFARASGFSIDETPANHLVIPITATAAQIESAFHVRMNLYRHPAEDRAFFSPDREPTLDAALPIAHIDGLNTFSLPRPLLLHPSASRAQPAATNSGSGPNGAYLATDMRAAYYGSSALTGAGQTIALVEFDGYNRSDVDLSFSSVGQTFTVPIQNVLLDGVDGSPTRGDDAEPVLDIVQAIGMAPSLDAVRVYIGTSDIDILNAIAADNLAQQVSISWTWAPDDPAIDGEFFLEMAAQGQSVFAASGDTGQFDPVNQDFYPAEDAFVTAVGGTNLVTTGPAGKWQSETAWNSSGGGISPDGVSIPPWQSGIANAANNASTTLRNVPDVAAEASFDNYVCAMGTCSGGWAGTSFAAPRWAAFTALINQQAALAGDPPAGFLNPALYALGPSSIVFHDITSGSNNTGSGDSFNAVPGYDLVTGWGSPAGQALIDALAPASASSLQLAASPSTLTLKPGSSTSTNLNLHAHSPVTLAITGLPDGVTPAWSSNPSTTTTTLTISATNAAIRGSSPLTITGTAGDNTASTRIALNIDAPGFTIAGAPAMQLYPGASATTTIAITPYAGFTGDVHFAVTSALPAGVTATWLDNPSTTSAQLTLTADSTANAAHVMLTVSGISGALTAATPIALTLSPSQFVLNLSPYPLQLAEGESQTSTVSVIPIGNFSGSVAITTPQLPSGVTAALQPSSTAASTLTLTASQSAPTGRWPAAIQGASSKTSSEAQFTQTITASRAARFTLAPSPAYARLTRGGSIAINVAIAALNGFASSVSLTASNLPNGVTASWVTASGSRNPASASSVLTLTAAPFASTSPAQPIAIEGTSGSLSSSAIFYLTIDPAPAFAISSSPSSVFLPIGGSATAAIKVIPQPGFAGATSLSVVSALPSGVTATVKSDSTSSTLSLSADQTASSSAFSLILEATGAGQTTTATIPVTITPPAPAIAGIAPALAAAGAAAVTLTVNGSAFSSGSTLYWNNSPRATRFVSPSQLTADISASDLVQPGVVSITIQNDTAVSNAFQFEIDSAAPAGIRAPAFTPTSVTIAAGQSAIYSVTLPAAVSSASAICLNLPAHATCTYSGSKLTISTSPDSPSGAWLITVVFTETQTVIQTTTATLLIPVLLFPYLLIRRRLAARTVRLADFLCVAIVAAGIITACGGANNSGSAPPPSASTQTFTSSGEVTLTLR
jgi:hypothetical protein